MPALADSTWEKAAFVSSTLPKSLSTVGLFLSDTTKRYGETKSGSGDADQAVG